MSATLTYDITVPVTSLDMGLTQPPTQRALLNLSFSFPGGSERPLRNPSESVSFSEPSLAPSAGHLPSSALCLSLRAEAGMCAALGQTSLTQTEAGVTAWDQAEFYMALVHHCRWQ